MTTSSSPDHLPTTIQRFLVAHRVRDADAALRAFAPAAVVVDDGSTYRGTEEIRGVLSQAGSEFTYTTTLVAAERSDDGSWVATHRLEGDFPGGVAVLRYRFAMDDDLVTELVIAP
jgi:ketosteroid isomerase-like protein